MRMARCMKEMEKKKNGRIFEKVTGPVVYKHPLDFFIVISINGIKETFMKDQIVKVWDNEKAT